MARPVRRSAESAGGLFDRSPLWWEKHGPDRLFETTGRRPALASERARAIAAAHELSSDELAALTRGETPLTATDVSGLLARNANERPPAPDPSASIRLVPWAWQGTYPPATTNIKEIQ